MSIEELDLRVIKLTKELQNTLWLFGWLQLLLRLLMLIEVVTIKAHHNLQNLFSRIMINHVTDMNQSQSRPL